MITRLLLGLCLAGSACSALAQPAGPIYATKTDIAAAIARAKAAIRPGHGTSSTPLIALGGYTAKLEYHTGPNIANAHPGQAEMFQAVEGTGTLVTGGTIVKTGETAIITGGTARPVAAGDVFIVPENMPHWFNTVDGHLILISVMLPRP